MAARASVLDFGVKRDVGGWYCRFFAESLYTWRAAFALHWKPSRP